MKPTTVRLLVTITANGGIHEKLIAGSSHDVRVDAQGRVWITGFGGCQILLREEEYRREQ